MSDCRGIFAVCPSGMSREQCPACAREDTIKELRVENAKLRKAAQAVVDTARRAKSQQVTYHYLPEIDSLAAVLEGVE